MIKISNICLHQNLIFIKFLKILKIHDIFCENPRIIFVLFYDVHKENINLEDGREAPSKACLLYFRYNANTFVFSVYYIIWIYRRSSSEWNRYLKGLFTDLRISRY